MAAGMRKSLMVGRWLVPLMVRRLSLLSYLHLRELVLEEPESTAWEGKCLHKEER